MAWATRVGFHIPKSPWDGASGGAELSESRVGTARFPRALNQSWCINHSLCCPVTAVA